MQDVAFSMQSTRSDQIRAVSSSTSRGWVAAVRHTQLDLHADGVSMAASSNMNTFNQYDNSVAEFWKRACL